jgi:phosphoenolpyruvate phosphomutase
MILFSEKGYKLFRDTYRRALAANLDTPFHEASSARAASFTDVIQELIDRGQKVACIEVSSGWMEIHSFNDYKQACMLLSGR